MLLIDPTHPENNTITMCANSIHSEISFWKMLGVDITEEEAIANIKEQELEDMEKFGVSDNSNSDIYGVVMRNYRGWY